ncbi:MAG: M56 family metallopeptidase [Pirellulales bacterium]
MSDSTTIVQIAQTWTDTLWRASWQGSIGIVAVLLLCRAWPQMPPGIQCWLWRAAYLKLLVLVAWQTPIELPLLPPANGGDAMSSGLVSGPEQSPRSVARGIRQSTGVESRTTAPAAQIGRTGGEMIPPVLCLGWLAGVTWHGARMAADFHAARRQRRRSRPHGEPVIDTLSAELAAGIGLGRAPAIRLVEDAGKVLLTGIVRPVVLLPASLLSRLERSEIKMVLAHELAHAKRHDLAWNWLAAIVRGLFFFHPLVWLAQRRWRMAQEMACDEQVLLRVGARAADYAELLIKVSTLSGPLPQGGLAAVGVAGSYRNLRERLMAMRHYSSMSGRKLWACRLAVAALGSMAIAPWQLTAQEAGRIADGGQSKQAAGDENGERTARQAEPREQLIGVWGGVGARGGEVQGQLRLTFFEDGTFEATVPAIDVGLVQLSGGVSSGTWKLDGDRLVRETKSRLPGEQGTRTADEIVRLDDSVLRLRDPDGIRGVEFFRRLKLKPLPAAPGGGQASQAGIKRVAELALLTEDETRAIQALAKRGKLDGVRLDLVERLADYQNKKVGFQSLVWFDDEEAKAYFDVMKLTGGRFTGLVALANEGQLTELETSGLDKLRLFRAVLEANRVELEKLEASGDLNPLEARAVERLRGYVEEQLDWAAISMFVC